MGSSIAQSFGQCLKSFESLISVLGRPGCQYAGEISLSGLQDEIGRLRVWAGNIGAHKTGRSSLDYRLRDASHIQQKIIRFLDDLTGMIQEAIAILSGDRKPYDDLSDSDSSADESSKAGSVLGNPARNGPKPTTELQQIFLDIVEIVNCLYKLSIAIRNPAPHDRYLKSAAIDTSFYEFWDIQHTWNKFPAAKEYLVIRLGKAITRRRQHLKYRQKHHQKLAQDIGRPVSAVFPQSFIPPEQVDQNHDHDQVLPGGLHDTEATPRAEPSVVATTVLTQTTATTFTGGNVEFEFELESDSGRSKTSYATSAEGGGKVRVPPPPKESLDGSPFECPYCYTIVIAKNSHSWTKHLFRDLQPYLCTFERCSRSDQSFESRHEWFDHELLVHRKEWFCSADCQLSFGLQREFEDHMRQSHSNSFAEAQLPALVDMCQRPVDLDAETICPLCDESMPSCTQLQRHLGYHMEELALFALPKDSGEIANSQDSDRVEVSEDDRDTLNDDLSDEAQLYVDSDSPPILEQIPESKDGPWDLSKDNQKKIDGNALLQGSSPNEWATRIDQSEDEKKVSDSENIDNLQEEIGTDDLAALALEMKHTPGDVENWRQVLTEASSIAPGNANSKHLSPFDQITNEINQSGHSLQEDWQIFWEIKDENLAGIQRKEVARQNNLHETLTTEYAYIGRLDVLAVLYRDQLAWTVPPAIEHSKGKTFSSKVFGKLDAVKKASEELLSVLRYRQREQGPWIVGFGDIIAPWAQKRDVREAYIEYAANYPNANMLIRAEVEINPAFRQFLQNAYEDERSRKLTWETYLQAPIKRLQQQPMILKTAARNTEEGTNEKENLSKAITELGQLVEQCSLQVEMNSKKCELMELRSKLQMRLEIEKIELNLDHVGREVIFRGDLQRPGPNRVTWLETHAILFDHYLVLAKPVQSRSKGTKYEVSKLPIPMDLLALQNQNVRRLVKPSSNLRGLIGRSTAPDFSIGTATGANDDETLFAFCIKHLGKSEVYTLNAPTEQNRRVWCDKIIEAKTKHAASLYAQKAEPLNLNVLADTAFEYGTLTNPTKRIVINGTPLERALRGWEARHDHAAYTREPICRAQVNCAAEFLMLDGKRILAIGTDYGVYMSNVENLSNWERVIATSRVTQIAFVPDCNLLLILADKSLVAYALDIVIPTATATATEPSRRAPQKVSGATDVGFFVVGRMKDRWLVFYNMRKSGLVSTASAFKACHASKKSWSLHGLIFVLSQVLEITSQKASKKSRSLFSGSWKETLEYFREVDEFYIPKECYGMDLFHSSIAIRTSWGFDIMTLDKRQTWVVPTFLEQHGLAIAARIKDQRPLGMFRLSDDEFFMCYEECGVYINKHGELLRGVIMGFVGKAQSATRIATSILVLFNPDFVEIRDIHNGRLRQVIAGKNIICLDDMRDYASEQPRTVKFAMAHPDIENRQLILEMLLVDPEKGESGVSNPAIS